MPKIKGISEKKRKTSTSTTRFKKILKELEASVKDGTFYGDATKDYPEIPVPKGNEVVAIFIPKRRK